jgi:hypothetical protein
VSNRAAEGYYDSLVAAFRVQVAEGDFPNFARAARAAGVGHMTARRIFEHGRSGTSTRGPLPPIRRVIEQDKAGATAAPSLPAPSPTAEVAAPPPALVPAATPATAPAVAPPVPVDTLAVESRAVDVTRHAVEGCSAIATTLLSGLMPLAAAARRQLELAVASGTCDARWCAQMLESLSTSLSKSSNSLARLVEAQSTLSGRPSQRVAVTRDAEPLERLSDDEIRRRAAIVWGDLEARVRELGAEQAEPVDVGPEGEGTEPAALPEIQEAEVIP